MKKFRYLITLCISLYTSSAWCAREAYIVVEDSVMTFYYDELRDTHQANTYPISHSYGEACSKTGKMPTGSTGRVESSNGPSMTGSTIWYLWMACHQNPAITYRE